MSTLGLTRAMLKLVEDAMKGRGLMEGLASDSAHCDPDPYSATGRAYTALLASCSQEELQQLRLRLCEAGLLQLNATFKPKSEG